MISQLVILAGGKGTRLAAVSGPIPKSLVRIGGKPLIQHQLELARMAGIADVHIFAGYLSDQIQSFVGDGTRFGLRIRVEVEAEPLGSAGSVLQKLDTLEDNFVVIYGDTMLAVDLKQFAAAHIGRSADMTVFVHPNDHPQDSDLVETNSGGWITSLHPYPHSPGVVFRNLVNAGLYVIRRAALSDWSGQAIHRDFAKDVLPMLLNRGDRVLAYRSAEYIKDMGTPERLQKVDRDWALERIKLRRPGFREPAVFFDRDGTMNVDQGLVRSPDQLEVFPGTGTALRLLRSAGYRLVVLTNQSVIARGEATENDVEAIHRKLEWELGKEGGYLDAIYYCPHHPDSGFSGERSDLKCICKCRKPATGMVRKACRDLTLDPTRSWMVGDTTLDIEMARRAGLRSVLVQTGSAGRDGKFDVIPDLTASNLPAAADLIIQAASVTSAANNLSAV